MRFRRGQKAFGTARKFPVSQPHLLYAFAGSEFTLSGERFDGYAFRLYADPVRLLPLKRLQCCRGPPERTAALFNCNLVLRSDAVRWNEFHRNGN